MVYYECAELASGVNHVTVLTATNLSLRPSEIPIGLIFPISFSLVDCYFFIASHFISFFCLVLYYVVLLFTQLLDF